MMLYFGHLTNSASNHKLKRLVKKYGFEGYGLYWYLNERVGEDLNTKNLSCLFKDELDIVADDFGSTIDKITEMLDYMVNPCQLITKEQDGYHNRKMLERLDEYTKRHSDKLEVQKNLVIPSSVGIVSDNVGIVSGKIKEINKIKELKNTNKTQRRPSDSAPVPGFLEFNVWWCKTWGERFGSKYDYAGAKDAKCVKSMLKNHSVEELKALAVMGWETSDNFLRGRCSTISGLSWALPQLIAKKPKDNFEEYNRAGRKS